MSSHTKIVVLRSKELVYALVLIVISVLIPGIYSSAIKLGSANVELQITVDADHINSITLSNLDESVSTLYPLMQPTLSELSASILENQSLDGISYTDENRYTSMLLMQAISATLDKALVSENADSPDMSTIY